MSGRVHCVRDGGGKQSNPALLLRSERRPDWSGMGTAGTGILHAFWTGKMRIGNVLDTRSKIAMILSVTYEANRHIIR